MDKIIQFIVPLTFLAIWALTAIFNREAQPLPPRQGRPQPPGGPGMGGPSGQRGEAADRDPTLRWSTTTGDRPSGRRSLSGDDAILIIEETRRPPQAGANRAGTGGSTRRAARPRPAPAGSTRRPEPTTARPLTGAVGSPLSMAQQMSQPLALSPLVIPSSPLLSQGQRNISQTVSEATRPIDARLPVTDEFRLLLENKTALRQAIVINEILQPPLSLRRRG